MLRQGIQCVYIKKRKYFRFMCCTKSTLIITVETAKNNITIIKAVGR